VLRRKEVTSALIGVRTLEQLRDCLGATDNLTISDDEAAAIDVAVKGGLLDQRPKTQF
jgi:L-glyceraldehyde 3-phosphate reductase